MLSDMHTHTHTHTHRPCLPAGAIPMAAMVAATHAPSLATGGTGMFYPLEITTCVFVCVNGNGI